jgi:hypothetical protein
MMNDEIEIRCSPDREAAGLLFFGGRISVWLGLCERQTNEFNACAFFLVRYVINPGLS